MKKNCSSFAKYHIRNQPLAYSESTVIKRSSVHHFDVMYFFYFLLNSQFTLTCRRNEEHCQTEPKWDGYSIWARPKRRDKGQKRKRDDRQSGENTKQFTEMHRKRHTSLIVFSCVSAVFCATMYMVKPYRGRNTNTMTTNHMASIHRLWAWYTSNQNTHFVFSGIIREILTKLNRVELTQAEHKHKHSNTAAQRIEPIRNAYFIET